MAKKIWIILPCILLMVFPLFAQDDYEYIDEDACFWNRYRDRYFQFNS